MKSEMFPDEVISNLPSDPAEGVRVLVEGYMDYVQHVQFAPMTDFEKCMDGYALIYAYNKSYDLGLELVAAKSDDENKDETIQVLNASILQVQTLLDGPNFM